MGRGQGVSLGLVALCVLALGACEPGGAEPAATASAQPTVAPTPVVEIEVCSDPESGASLSYPEALGIAQASECTVEGKLLPEHTCNQNTGTWWIDLEMDAPGCSPACVVHVENRTAAINYRCTGAIPPEPTPSVLALEPARDALLDHLRIHWGALAPPDLSWTDGVMSTEAGSGQLCGEFAAGDWAASVTPVPAADPVTYRVRITNTTTGVGWEATVDGGGQVLNLTMVDADAQAAFPVAYAWYGRVSEPPDGSPAEAQLIVLPEGTGALELIGTGKPTKGMIGELIISGGRAHFWGYLVCDAAGICRMAVEQVRPDGPGEFLEPDAVDGWEGVLYSGPPGPRSGGDDYFALTGEWAIQYGVHVSPEDEELATELEKLRDTGRAVRLWGSLTAGIPDWNGTLIQVTALEGVPEPEGEIPRAPQWSETDDGLELYTNADYGYQLRLPPSAAVTERGPDSYPTDELPDGMTPDEYMAQLTEAYGQGLCVQVQVSHGYITILAPAENANRYSHCGRTGVGAGEILSKEEQILVGDSIYVAQGFEFVGLDDPCAILACHHETMVVTLEDGTRIEYGALPSGEATYEDYLAQGKPLLLQILASYQEAD